MSKAKDWSGRKKKTACLLPAGLADQTNKHPVRDNVTSLKERQETQTIFRKKTFLGLEED